MAVRRLLLGHATQEAEEEVNWDSATQLLVDAVQFGFIVFIAFRVWAMEQKGPDK